MPQTSTVADVTTDSLSDTRIEDMYQVVLFNDDHNAAEFVVVILMRVFGHPMQLAGKIMLEAHNNGRSIADVEAKELAIKHKQQLESFGLTAAAEPVH
jgi:ATP-dependent Clp protease adapter protein ClpS